MEIEFLNDTTVGLIKLIRSVDVDIVKAIRVTEAEWGDLVDSGLVGFRVDVPYNCKISARCEATIKGVRVYKEVKDV